MASPPVVVEPAITPGASGAKPSLMSFIFAIVAAVFLCVALLGGAAFYLVRSGKLSLGKTGSTESASPPPAVTQAHVMVLEPMVANLADTGGAAYLKISLTLRVADDIAKKDASAKEEKPAKGISDADAAVRDTVLMVVGRQASDQLLAPNGKEQLKSALKAALAEHNPELKVLDLYFVDFLVQR